MVSEDEVPVGHLVEHLEKPYRLTLRDLFTVDPSNFYGKWNLSIYNHSGTSSFVVIPGIDKGPRGSMIITKRISLLILSFPFREE